jgi:hypothetical protein
MLHTLRQIVNDDEKWRALLRGLNRDFYHQVVKGSQIENYMSEFTGMNLKPFFDQYLRDVRIPVLEYYLSGSRLYFRWNNCVPGFNMPVRVFISGEPEVLTPTSRFSFIETGKPDAAITVDPNYYVASLRMTGD